MESLLKSRKVALFVHRRCRTPVFKIASLAAVSIALIATATALAAPFRTSANYFLGTRNPGEGAGSVYDHQGCWANYGSWAQFTGDANDAVTVALIDANGSWRRSLRIVLITPGTTAPFDVRVSPDTLAQAQSYDKKAHCVNSGPTQVTVSCAREYWSGLSCA